MMDEKNKIKQIREAFAQYVASEGCRCCQNVEKHQDAEKKMAKLLGVKKYKDGSGFDFYAYLPKN